MDRAGGGDLVEGPRKVERRDKEGIISDVKGTRRQYLMGRSWRKGIELRDTNQA